MCPVSLVLFKPQHQHNNQNQNKGQHKHNQHREKVDPAEVHGYNFDGLIISEGVLEMMPDGYGFLRSSDYCTLL